MMVWIGQQQHHQMYQFFAYTQQDASKLVEELVMEAVMFAYGVGTKVGSHGPAIVDGERLSVRLSSK